jgi:hypothetical protein
MASHGQWTRSYKLEDSKLLSEAPTTPFPQSPQAPLALPQIYNSNGSFNRRLSEDLPLGRDPKEWRDSVFRCSQK